MERCIMFISGQLKSMQGGSVAAGESIHMLSLIYAMVEELAQLTVLCKSCEVSNVSIYN